MSRKRFRLKGERAVYHCVTRTVNKEMLFHDEAKERLRRMIWQVADFSGVTVLAYCVMSNHFHVLVRVPGDDDVEISDAELMRRYRVLYPKPTRYQIASAEVLEQVLEAGGEDAEMLRRGLLARMHDISQFMKNLKQRFSIWYNRSHERIGTLWAERFTSTLVEESDVAQRTVAAYIDLNPVRAGLVNDPKDFRWSSYGEAIAGAPVARNGLTEAVNGPAGKDDWIIAGRTYRQLLYGKGVMPAPGKAGRAAQIPIAEWRREMERGGQIPIAAALRCKVRYFTDGTILGSSTYVEAIFRQFRHEFGQRRVSGARTMKGSRWDGLKALRDLQKGVFD